MSVSSDPGGLSARASAPQTASETAASTDDSQPVRLILAAVASVLFLASLGQTIVTTALPIIVGDLHGLDHITWVVTAYLLASTVGAPICGKLGDLYGRKVVLQGAILVFLAGSVLAGLAQSMGVMIAGRAVQGLAGGGLIVVAMATVADVLPPRERGKAQGLLGAVFGVSTVVGPLLGGFLVQQLNWHWVFFVNLPVGLVALAVLGAVLKSPATRVKHAIDYAGAALLTGVLSAAVLVANLGGSAFAWSSPEVLGLIGAGGLALAGFVWIEARAAEPILPLPLFRINAFVVVNTVGFLVGSAMFGTITFLPLYLQVVQGLSPATSGMFLLPMMAGLIGSSALAGRQMSASGRYKRLPILSTGVLTVGMALMATIGAATPLPLVAVYMVLVGLGIGPVLSVGVAAIQNAVPRETLGVATASANMFRLIGGSVGTAAFGALFAAGLSGRLAGLLPDSGTGLGALTAKAVAAMPEGTRGQVLDAFASALHPVFFVACGLAAVACGLSVMLKELPLATAQGNAR